MSKLVIFDLDGVLIDSRDLHFECLNKALGEISQDFVISMKEHLTKYDGLSTNQKLKKLNINKGLPEKYFEQVWKNKQEYTFKMLYETLDYDVKLVEMFSHIKSKGYKICVASNSIRKTIDIVLERKDIIRFVDLIVSNEDVEFPKPNPQIYLTCMKKFGIGPKNTYIFEDSHIGRLSAFASGAIVCPVNNSKDLTWSYVMESINKKDNMNMKWVNKKMNVLIPMAGEGSRFAKAGFTFPKPLIEVNGKPMIQVVIENLNIDANFIFLVRKEHDDKFNITSMLKAIVPDCKVVLVDKLTEGAACTTLLAKELIDNDNSLLIANSDQFLEWESCEFYHSVNTSVDGSILTFENYHPKWSYAKLDEDGNVLHVAEKEVISNKATVGIYYFAKGSDYVKYAEQMIEKDIRYGQSFNGTGEFYVAPVYNEAIADGKIIKTFDIKKMWGLGTPSDLEDFKRNNL
jgi:HAD superfamily hydrolase (TIGR01509 family)